MYNKLAAPALSCSESATAIAVGERTLERFLRVERTDRKSLPHCVEGECYECSGVRFGVRACIAAAGFPPGRHGVSGAAAIT